MNDQRFQRRRSYGPSSPTVGDRGARTRRQIVDASLCAFTHRGYHDTSIEDITVLAETSRATLYQYFECKSAIFAELMRETSSALDAYTRELGPLGPTRSGYESISHWVAGWCRTYRRYEAIIVQWQRVIAPDNPFRQEVVTWTDAHADRFGRALRDSPYRGPDPSSAAVAAAILVNRSNQLHRVYRPGSPGFADPADLAALVQLFLFPDTPMETLDTAQLAAEPDRHPAVDGAAEPRRAGGRPRKGGDDPTTTASRQTEGTIRALLDSSRTVFATRGYQDTNIEQIVAAAGVARGTFYRYFSGKSGVFASLSREAAGALAPLLERLDERTARQPRALRAWLHSYLHAQRTHLGLTRAWAEVRPLPPEVLAPAARTVDALNDTAARLFGAHLSERRDRHTAAIGLAAMLDHFPATVTATCHRPDDDQIVEIQARYVETVLLRV